MCGWTMGRLFLRMPGRMVMGMQEREKEEEEEEETMWDKR